MHTSQVHDNFEESGITAMNHLDRSPYKDDDIAVIGIGLRIAGTNNLEEFWGYSKIISTVSENCRKAAKTTWKTWLSFIRL